MIRKGKTTKRAGGRSMIQIAATVTETRDVVFNARRDLPAKTIEEVVRQYMLEGPSGNHPKDLSSCDYALVERARCSGVVTDEGEEYPCNQGRAMEVDGVSLCQSHALERIASVDVATVRKVDPYTRTPVPADYMIGGEVQAETDEDQA